MLKRLVVRWAVLTLAVWLAATLVPGVHVHGGFLTMVWVALLFGLVNAFLGPILRVLSFPLTFITLGLFALVVNAALVGITAWLSSKFDVDGFWSAFLTALVISVVSMVSNLLTGKKR